MSSLLGIMPVRSRYESVEATTVEFGYNEVVEVLPTSVNLKDLHVCVEALEQMFGHRSDCQFSYHILFIHSVLLFLK